MTSPESWGDPRSRTVTWHDPVAAAKAGLALAGIDYFAEVIEGRLPPPPIAQTLSFTVDRAEHGKVWFSTTPDESVYNPLGMVHGGLVCTLLDSVCGCAVHTTLPAGVGYSSIEIKVNYLRPIFADSGALTAHGWVTKPGRRVAFAEGEITNAEGKTVATASSSLLIMGGATG